ncbi:hypothetical protein BS47DRAFT_1364526 [Hydnum rufescens UP504]|uniref:HD domain-containing protein n=1 Tax=Hydnum rufescens UP504 TaxID=1448309 RepID=A0A9P6AR62_9AGAM|nr:hypothetical protein BS47DRAFT_1364526 [Hydnum rufescens UP504]
MFEDLISPDTHPVNKARKSVQGRVFYLGQATARNHFPGHSLDLEAYYLSGLFHDIGCSENNLRATKMSFEFYGGIIARGWLLRNGTDQNLADSVAETIFRHTDCFRYRKPHSTRSNHPIDNLGQCFGDTMQMELNLKPWSHTTALLKDEFVNAARENPYGKKFEKE